MPNRLYMPGCTHDSPPPLVLTGNAPPGAIRPSATNGPPSPFWQKPRSSRNRMGVMGKKSYTPTTTTHLLLITPPPTPARSTATGPEIRAAVTVRSSMQAICRCECAMAVPSTWTGLRGPSWATSDACTTTAAAPSVTRQQSRTVSGDEIMRAPSTSSRLIGSRRLRVERGPRAGRQCHLGQLLARRTVLVHVPLRYQCVARGRIERCVRFLERKGVQLRANGGGGGDAAPTAWRGAIGDDHVAAQAGPNRGCGD